MKLSGKINASYIQVPECDSQNHHRSVLRLRLLHTRCYSDQSIPLLVSWQVELTKMLPFQKHLNNEVTLP